MYLVWLLSVVLVLIGGAEDLSNFGNEDCSVDDAMAFSSSAFDMGMLSAAGCDMSDIMGVSQTCCHVADVLFSHPCLEVTTAMGFTVEGSMQYMLELYSLYCGVTLGVGYDSREDCGNGTVTGWEHCDDGNLVEGDGCTDCWVDEMFTCETLANGTSLCRECAMDCEYFHREMCDTPFGVCGHCYLGYTDVNGTCVKVFDVYYVFVDDPSGMSGLSSTCTFEWVEQVLEPNPDDPSLATYVNLVRQKIPTPSPYSDALGDCSLFHAFRSVPTGDSVIAVIEVAEGVVNASTIASPFDPNGSQIFLFSSAEAGLSPAVLVAYEERMFDVAAGCTLMISNLILSRGSAAEGGFFLSYGGTVILDNVSMTNGSTKQLEPTRVIPELACTGSLMSVSGSVILRHVAIYDNIFEALENPEKCLSLSPNGILSYGTFSLMNVTLVRNRFVGPFLVVSGSDISINSLYAYENAMVDGRLVSSESYLSIRDFVAVNNTGGRSSIIMSHTGLGLEDFLISGNTADGGVGLIYNAGSMKIRNGRVENNYSNSYGSLIWNRSTLTMHNVTIVRNSGSFMDSTSKAIIEDCHIAENTGSSTYLSIKNSGMLVINNCSFDDPLARALPAISDVHVESQDTFLLWSSSVPGIDTTKVATCSTQLPSVYEPYEMACGTRALCQDLGSRGVNCSCPESHPLGDPTLLCGRLATLFVLPDAVLDVYLTKPLYSSDSYETDTEIRLIADGMGVLYWEVDNATLPNWVSMNPMSTTFESEGVCPDAPVDVFFTFSSEHLIASEPYITVTVNISSVASYFDPVRKILITSPETVPIDLRLVVEVLPSPETSFVSVRSPCDATGGKRCRVQSLSIVHLSVHLRDSANYSMGLGGGTFDVSSSEIITFTFTDYNNGSYGLEFEAPRSPFSVDITLSGVSIQSSPLAFDIRCPHKESFDDKSGRCEKDSFRIPRFLVGVTLVSLFVVIAAVVRFVQRRNMTLTASFMKNQATLTVVALFMDILDIGTDLGVVASVMMEDSLSAYVPWYLSMFTIAAITAFVSVFFHARALYRMMNVSDTDRGSESDSNVKVSIAVTGLAGISQINTQEEIAAVLKVLTQVRNRQIIGFAVLIVEDIPFQVLNSVLMISSGNSFPMFVLFSTQITMILIGVKISKITSAWNTAKKIARLREKAKYLK
eukprot:Rmarinus@m.14026